MYTIFRYILLGGGVVKTNLLNLSLCHSFQTKEEIKKRNKYYLSENEQTKGTMAVKLNCVVLLREV